MRKAPADNRKRQPQTPALRELYLPRPRAETCCRPKFRLLVWLSLSLVSLGVEEAAIWRSSGKRSVVAELHFAHFG